MKLRPRTEMKILASGLACISLVFLGSLAWTIPIYSRWRSLGWQSSFRTEKLFEHFMEAFRYLAFGVAPGIALVCGAGCWIVLKHYRKIPNEDAA